MQGTHIYMVVDNPQSNQTQAHEDNLHPSQCIRSTATLASGCPYKVIYIYRCIHQCRSQQMIVCFCHMIYMKQSPLYLYKTTESAKWIYAYLAGIDIVSLVHSQVKSQLVVIIRKVN